MTPDADTGHGLERERLWRKKPVVIEAVQWTGTNFLEIELFTNVRTEFSETPNALGHTLYIFTLEGRMSAPVGAWVIKGVAGEFYACDEAIFAKTYEPAARADAEAGRARELEAEVTRLEKLFQWVEEEAEDELTLPPQFEKNPYAVLRRIKLAARAALAPRPEAGATAKQGEEV